MQTKIYLLRCALQTMAVGLSSDARLFTQKIFGEIESSGDMAFPTDGGKSNPFFDYNTRKKRSFMCEVIDELKKCIYKWEKNNR